MHCQESVLWFRLAVLQVEPDLVAHWYLLAGLYCPFPPVMEQQARTACSGLSLTWVITGLNFGLAFSFSSIAIYLL